MHLANIYDVRCGEVIANTSGCPEGAVVTPNLLDKLMSSRIRFVWIEDNRKPVNIEDELVASGYLYADSIVYPILSVSDLIPNTLQQMLIEDRCTLYHSINVAILSKYIAGILCLREDTIKEITTAALLHDIGKLQIPSSILKKEGKLTKAEFSKVKEHPAVGHIILQQEGVFNTDIIRGVSEHHERWDGHGYPLGLRACEIHLYARIIAIADVYDALVSKRCYKKELSPEQAINMMLADTGHFDDVILHKFLHSIENTSNTGVNILRIS